MIIWQVLVYHDMLGMTSHPHHEQVCEGVPQNDYAVLTRGVVHLCLPLWREPLEREG
jgi:hypothetical protein